MNTTHPLSRRTALRWTAAGAGAAFAPALMAQANAAPPVGMEIWKDASCGCCGDWIKHMQAKGFKLDAIHDTGNNAVRARLGLAAKYGSGHTALIGGGRGGGPVAAGRGGGPPARKAPGGGCPGVGGGRGDG